MAQIPSDVWPEILLGLPSKSVLRFRAVCKTWLSIIDDPCFVRAHTNKQQLSSNTTILIRSPAGPPLYSLDLETLNPTRGGHKISATPLNYTRRGLSRLRKLYKLSSCNGLILVSPKGRYASIWEIWNPLTHERLHLPHQDFRQWIEACGLGYDSASDDYKAVVIDSQSYNKPTVLVTHVYSLKSDSWRKIMDYPGCYPEEKGIPGVYLSGALHWISSSSSKDPLHWIVALDLATESYRKLKMPPCRVLNEYDENEMPLQCQDLNVLSGCLVVSDAAENDFFDLWVRMDYGAEDSWTKVFKISGRDTLYPSNYLDLKPVAYMKNKTQVFMQQEKGVIFYLFDLESGSAKKVSIHGLSGLLSAQAFHGTIFQLHDNCGVSGTRKRKKRKFQRKSKSKKKMADIELIFGVRDSNSQFCLFLE